MRNKMFTRSCTIQMPRFRQVCVALSYNLMSKEDKTRVVNMCATKCLHGRKQIQMPRLRQVCIVFRDNLVSQDDKTSVVDMRETRCLHGPIKIQMPKVQASLYALIGVIDVAK